MAFRMKGYSAFTKKTDPPKKKHIERLPSMRVVIPPTPKRVEIDTKKKQPIVRTGYPPKSLLEDVVREKDKYPKGKQRYWKNLKYKITKNPKHLKK